MTETTGGHTISKETEFRLEAVGRKREGVHSKIVNPDENQQGEVRHKISTDVMYCVKVKVFFWFLLMLLSGIQETTKYCS